MIQRACFLNLKFTCRDFSTPCAVPPLWYEEKSYINYSRRTYQDLPEDCKQGLSPENTCPSDVLIISYEESTTEEEIAAIVDKYQLVVRKKFKYIPFVSYRNKGGFKTYCNLKKEPKVKSIELNCLDSFDL